MFPDMAKWNILKKYKPEDWVTLNTLTKPNIRDTQTIVNPTDIVTKICKSKNKWTTKWDSAKIATAVAICSERLKGKDAFDAALILGALWFYKHYSSALQASLAVFAADDLQDYESTPEALSHRLGACAVIAWIHLSILNGNASFVQKPENTNLDPSDENMRAVIKAFHEAINDHNEGVRAFSQMTFCSVIEMYPVIKQAWKGWKDEDAKEVIASVRRYNGEFVL
jgi:hypothetical protein